MFVPRGGRCRARNGIVMRDRPCACERSLRAGGGERRTRGGVGSLHRGGASKKARQQQRHTVHECARVPLVASHSRRRRDHVVDLYHALYRGRCAARATSADDLAAIVTVSACAAVSHHVRSCRASSPCLCYPSPSNPPRNCASTAHLLCPCKEEAISSVGKGSFVEFSNAPKPTFRGDHCAAFQNACKPQQAHALYLLRRIIARRSAQFGGNFLRAHSERNRRAGLKRNGVDK